MIYLIKLIFILLIFVNLSAAENLGSEVIFKLNNKFFTNVDLENRTKYISLINKLDASKFNESEKKEIQDDYISSLIFYEYYIKNKIFYRDFENEINTIFLRSIKDVSEINDVEIKNLKFNMKLKVRLKYVNFLMKLINFIDNFK